MMVSKLRRNYLPELWLRSTNWSRPNMVTINLSARCNQQCIYCEIGTAPLPSHQDILSYDDLVWILDQMALNNIRKIALCGGEPMLFDRLIDVVEHAHTKKIRCYITSNGMTIHRLSDKDLNILKSRNAEVNISIDSLDADILSKTRGSPNALSNALRSIEVLQKKAIPTTVLTVISKYNFSGLYKFITAAVKKNIRQVLFQPVITYSNFPERPPLDNKSSLNVHSDDLHVLEKELNKILEFEQTNPISTNVYRIKPWIASYIRKANGGSGKWFFHDVVNQFFCRDIYTMIDISYEGLIQPCGLKQGYINIFDNREKGLLGLWTEATKQIKDDLSHQRYYACCNGCCHHFSRNMYASILKHPVMNFKALRIIAPLLFFRLWWRIVKKTRMSY